MALDPHMRRLVAALSMVRAAPGDLPARRAAFRRLMSFSGEADRSIAVSEQTRPVPFRLYVPPRGRSPGPALIYFHGGGFVCGDLDTHDSLCRTIAAESRCRVVSVGYRLAPEHRFPAALEDAETAAGHVFAAAGTLGIDPARVAIGGDSAGATLAAAISRRWATRHPGRLAAQLLLCPILDWSGSASRPSGDGYVLNAASMAEELRCYLPAGQDAADPDVSPLRNRNWSALPPALIHTAECDPVQQDGARYAERLRASGVAARHTCHGGMIHLFYAFGRLVPRARAALSDIGAELAAALA